MEPQVPGICPNEEGRLPTCGRLSYPYVPVQAETPSLYQAPMGLNRGTIYPGLDLPFMKVAQPKAVSSTPLHQLQAYYFAVSELGLYLDTHPEDQDAVALFNQYVEQYADAMQQYEQEYGSLTQLSSALTGTYQWVKDPWPWDYNANEEG